MWKHNTVIFSAPCWLVFLWVAQPSPATPCCGGPTGMIVGSSLGDPERWDFWVHLSRRRIYRNISCLYKFTRIAGAVFHLCGNHGWAFLPPCRLLVRNHWLPDESWVHDMLFAGPVFPNIEKGDVEGELDTRIFACGIPLYFKRAKKGKQQIPYWFFSHLNQLKVFR